MGNSPSDRQSDKLEASSADMSFITKGTCDLTVQTGASQGENQVENVYCENQLLAGSCQLQRRKKKMLKTKKKKKKKHEETLLKQRKQWPRKEN